jgi:hypothetical protein
MLLLKVTETCDADNCSSDHWSCARTVSIIDTSSQLFLFFCHMGLIFFLFADVGLDLKSL